MAQESRLTVVIDSRQAVRDAHAISTELQSIQRNGDYAAKSMNGASTAVREFAGYMAGIVTVGAAISKMDTYTGINNQLKLVTHSQIQLSSAMNETFAIAQRSRSSWESVTQVYQKLAMNAEAAGIAQKDIGRLTETISKGIALSGSSSEQAAAAIMQLGQSLGAGKLSGDEFNSVMENGYGVMQLLAKGMNVPIGQLKKLAGEGKLTSEVVTQALLKMSSTADAEFAKTDATIGQSLGMLSNAVTQFVGEAGKGSGAANLLSGSIQTLAGNLDLIADIAVVGSVAYLTKSIVGQTIAVKGAIAASMQRRAANLAELETQIQLSGLEVQRTRQVAGLALTELHLARQELNNATTRQARAAATMRLTQAEVALALAEKQRTAATIADTAAQNANNAARSRGAMLLGLVGGPVGALTLGVTALAAIYMLATDNGEEANKMLEEQGKFAGMATTELEKLEGVQRRAANESLALTFKTQTNQLKGLKQEFIEATEQILDHNKKNLEVQRIYNELRAGVLGVEEAFNRLNKIETIGKDDIANAANYRDKYRELNNTLAETKPKLEATAAGIDSARLKAQQGAQAVFKLNAELEKLFNQAKGNIVEATVTKRLADLNYDDRLISIINKYVAVEGSINTATGKFYDEVKKRITEEYKAVLAQDKALDGRNEREKERLSILEQQGKVLQVNSKVQANAAKYNFSQLESNYKLPSGTLSSIHMIESKGNAEAYNKSTGASGGFQFLKGTADQYGVKNRNDLAQSAEGAAKYMSYLLKLFKGDLEKAVRAYHAGEGNVQKGKNIGKYNNQYWKDFQGYMAGQSGLSFDAEFTVNDFDKILDDRIRLLAEQAETRKRIEYEAADEIGKIRQSLADRIQEIEAADFSADKVSELKFQAQQRADIEIQILEAAKQDKIASYSDYMKSEEQLLNESYAHRQRDLKHDLDLTAEEYTELSLNLEKQRQQELAWMKMAQEQRIFEAEQFMMGEMERIRKRYTFEYMEIAKITDLEERRRKISALNANFIRGGVGKVSSDLNDTSGQFLKSMNYASVPKTNLQRLDEDNEKTLQKLRDNLAAVKESERTSHEERLEAERIFLEAKQQLQDEYDFKAFDARKADQENQLQLYNQMLTSASSTWGSLTQIVKDARGESSNAFKAMFLAQQSFAAASAIVSAHLAAVQTTADITLPFVGKIPAASAILAFGYANAGIIAGQTIAGMAHNGIDNIPKEGTWLLDGGERVLNPQQNRDLTQYLSVQRETRQTNLVAAANAPAPQINIEVINQVSGVTVETEQISEREIRLIVRDEMPKAFEEQISNPNSRVSRAVSKNTTARRNR